MAVLPPHPPRFGSRTRVGLATLEGPEEAPTWRGWVLGLCCCALLAAVIPYIDLILRGTRLTFNLLPAGSMVLLFVFILGFNLGAGRWRRFFRLSRQDLALVFCMTMLMGGMAGGGCMNYLVNSQLGLSNYTRPENGWRETLYPVVPTELTVRDPYRVEPVRACATSDVGGAFRPGDAGALYGAALNVDGVVLRKDQRVLLAGQRDARQNGIYVVADEAEGRLDRASDANASASVNWGLYTFVQEGQTYARKGFWLTTHPPIALNESALEFRLFHDESELPRPAEWFYAGLPQRGAAEWEALRALAPIVAPSYLRWCVALIFVFAVFFALGALLRRQWSEREQLPFPLAQVPHTMMEGACGEHEKPFVADGLAWAGILLMVVLHSCNFLHDYYPAWPEISLMNDLRGYFTERPWQYLRPVHAHIFPSVVAFMYLVSREVSFSLWFFYFVVLKIGVLIAAGVFGLGEDGWYFHSGEGPRGIFVNQGAGALLMLALASLFMARHALWSSLRQAAGLAPRDPQESFSPRAVWTVLLLGLGGLAAWMIWHGLAWYWSVSLALLMPLGAIGTARIVLEGGALYVKGTTANGWLDNVFSPAALGSKNYVLSSMYGHNLSFDSFRMNPLTNVLAALHLASLSRLRARPLFTGLVLALVVTFAVAFASYYYVCYTSVIGARPLGWAFSSWAEGNYTDKAAKTRKIEYYEKTLARQSEQGAAAGTEALPDIARTDWTRITCLGLGGAFMALFLFLRSRVFWWPHPVGYVMWVSPQPIYQMAFSYFLGWLIKSLVVKFGGQRIFNRWKRFFVGLVVGEALATFIWIIVAWWAGHSEGYKIEYN